MNIDIKYLIRAVVVWIFQSILWIKMRIAFLIFGKFTVTGLENIKDIDGAIIFAPNHANDMDAVFLGTALPFLSRFFPVYFVTHPFNKYSGFKESKAMSMTYKFLPFIITGSVPIESDSKDYKIALKRHIKILQKGGSVCIFPEGIKTRDGSLGEPRGGVAYMGQATHAPIIPVTISGTFQLTLKKFFTSKPIVTIHFGEPMYASDIVSTTHPVDVRYREAAKEIFRNSNKLR